MKYLFVGLLVLLSACAIQTDIGLEIDKHIANQAATRESGEFMAVYSEEFERTPWPQQREVYQKNGMRVEQVKVTGGQSEQYYTAMLSDQLVKCQRVNEWSCTKTPFSGEEEKKFVQEMFMDTSTAIRQQIKLENLTHEYESMNEREIAGEMTRCYKTRVNDGVNKFEQQACFASNGVPLFTLLQSEGTTIMRQEAISYDSNVDDAVFEPPAEPLTLKQYVGAVLNSLK